MPVTFVVPIARWMNGWTAYFFDGHWWYPLLVVHTDKDGKPRKTAVKLWS